MIQTVDVCSLRCGWLAVAVAAACGCSTEARDQGCIPLRHMSLSLSAEVNHGSVSFRVVEAHGQEVSEPHGRHAADEREHGVRAGVEPFAVAREVKGLQTEG